MALGLGVPRDLRGFPRRHRNLLLRRSPELAAERGRIGADTKRWDKIIGTVWTLVIGPALLVTAGLDARFGWTPPLGGAAHVAGTLVFVAGYAIFVWAMLSNRFFSGVVRIQTDRGHCVETGGPYRYVRHPGYVGMCIALPGTAILLGSAWALVPAAAAIAILLVRTDLEDRTLCDELPGYRQYAARVRYRWLPGVW